MSSYSSATPTSNVRKEGVEALTADTFFSHAGGGVAANLISCLALYQHRQDQAAGINWLSSKTRGLLWYYNHLQQKQLANLMTAAYLNGVIQQGAKEIKKLVKKAEKAGNKQQILEYALVLQSEIEKAKDKLDDIEKINT